MLGLVRVLSGRIALVLSMTIVGLAVFAAIAAPWLPIADPNAMDAMPYTPLAQSTGSGPTITAVTFCHGSSGAHGLHCWSH